MKSRRSVSTELVLSRRIRKTPFEERVFENGARAFTVYNQMPLASYYRSAEEDYAHLKEFVQIWDVAVERQVEVRGPDALALVELVTPRDISRCQIGQCMYAPLVNEHGGIVNDPIVIRLAEDRFWISIADSGVLLWMSGIAYGRNLDVEVFEPDVSPLAVQGPRSDDLMAELIGEQVRDIRFFWFIRAELAGTSFIIARSGWSGQGGFEIYLEEFDKGLDLWDAIWEAGQKYNIRAGCPNLIDRIESGLLSFGSDMVPANNPYEAGLGRFVDDTKAAECMSSEALARVRESGPDNQLAYLTIDGDKLSSPRSTWDVLDDSGKVVGILTSLAWSLKFQTNLAFATIETGANVVGNKLSVKTGKGDVKAAQVRNRFWEVPGKS